MNIRPSGLLGVLLAILLTAAPAASAQRSSGGQSPCPDADLQPSPETLPRVEAAMVCLMNDERNQVGLPTFRVEPHLEASAMFHTDDMLAYHYFAHQGPDRPALVTRVRATRYFEGVAWALYSENLGFGPEPAGTAWELVRAWMESDVHRINILYPTLTEVGIGSAMVGPEPAFWPDRPSALYTVDFGHRYGRLPPVRRRVCIRRVTVRTRTRASREESALKPRRYCSKKRTVPTKKRKRRRSTRR